MDAITGSAGSGFDAALKALEDLESDVALSREASAPSAAAPAAIVPSIGIADAVVIPALAILSEPASPSISVEAVDPAPEPLAADSAPVAEVIEAAPAEPAPHAIILPPARRSVLPVLAVGLGLLSSAMAGAGLLVVSRTVNGAALVVADARERQAQLRQVGQLIAELEAARARQLALLQRQQDIVAAAPLSAQDLDQRIGALKAELAAQDKSAKMLESLHDGQNQLNATLGAIGMKVSRIEDKLGEGR